MAEIKRALITGITGQDGSYLAELLLEKGYEVALGKTSGVQLASASETNKDMKEQLQRDKSTQVAVTNKTLNVNQTQTAQSTSNFDDRSALERKQTTV